MIYGEQQKKEIETIRERAFTLKLSDADVDRLAMKAAEAGMTMGELLASFVGDLVGGTYSNGSDERMYAEAWYERCGFSFYPQNDIARLAKADALDQMVDYVKAYREAAEDLTDTKRDFEDPDCDDITEADVQRAEEWLVDSKKEVEDLMKYVSCTGTMEEVAAAVLKWDEDLRSFKSK